MSLSRFPSSRGRARAAVLSSTVTVVLLLSACTSGVDDESVVSPSPTGTEQATDPAGVTGSGTGAVATAEVPGGLPAGVTVGELPAAADIGNDNDKRVDVSITGCAAVDGGWGASGQASNTSEETRNYAITVFFTTTDSTTVDFAVAEVEVEPGEIGRWEASGQFAAPEDMFCVLRGVG